MNSFFDLVNKSRRLTLHRKKMIILKTHQISVEKKIILDIYTDELSEKDVISFNDTEAWIQRRPKNQSDKMM